MTKNNNGINTDNNLMKKSANSNLAKQSKDSQNTTKQNKNNNKENNKQAKATKDTSKDKNNKDSSNTNKKYPSGQSNSNNKKNNTNNGNLNKNKSEKKDSNLKNPSSKKLDYSKYSIVEIIDLILIKQKKRLNSILLIICLILGSKLMYNIFYDGKDVSDIKKTNKNLETQISKLNKEKEDLNKEFEQLLAENDSLEEDYNNLVNQSFKAVPGTRWAGNIDFIDEEQEDLKVSLDINNDEIILLAKDFYLQHNYEDESQNYFDVKLSLSSGEMNKAQGYIKLNRLSFKNPPEHLHSDYYDRILPYNYYILFNDTHAIGYLLDENLIVGTMHLKMAE